MLRKVGEKGTAKVEEAEDASEYKKTENQKMETYGKEKRCMGNMLGT